MPNDLFLFNFAKLLHFFSDELKEIFVLIKTSSPGGGGPEVQQEAVLVCLCPGSSSTGEERAEPLPVVEGGPQHWGGEGREAGPERTGQELHGCEDGAAGGTGQVEGGAAPHHQQSLL